MPSARFGSTVGLATRGDQRAVRDLTVLAALVVPGYLLERSGRAPAPWDPVESPVVASVGLAAAMA